MADRRAIKVRNIRRNPAVALCVCTPDHPYSFVTIEGTAEVTDSGLEDMVRRTCVLYEGQERGAEFSAGTAGGRTVDADRHFARPFHLVDSGRGVSDLLNKPQAHQGSPGALRLRRGCGAMGKTNREKRPRAGQSHLEFAGPALGLKPGVQCPQHEDNGSETADFRQWIPAFAGMTVVGSAGPKSKSGNAIALRPRGDQLRTAGAAAILRCARENSIDAHDGRELIMAFAHPEFLVSTEWLSNHLEDENVRVFETTVFLHRGEGSVRAESGRAEYEKGHIPGAGFLDLQADFSDNDKPYRFMMPSAEAFGESAGRHGISESSTLVLYDRLGSQWAARFLVDVPLDGVRRRGGAGWRLESMDGRGSGGVDGCGGLRAGDVQADGRPGTLRRPGRGQGVHRIGQRRGHLPDQRAGTRSALG